MVGCWTRPNSPAPLPTDCMVKTSKPRNLSVFEDLAAELLVEEPAQAAAGELDPVEVVLVDVVGRRA